MVIPGGFTVRARSNFINGGFDIAFLREGETGLQIYNFKYDRIDTVNHNYLVSAELMGECSLTISPSTGQALIEQLRSGGVNDREKSLAEGRLEKQSDHLKDLQNILRTKGMMK